MEDGSTNAQPGKLEAFEAMRLRVQRSNMLGACRFAVDSEFAVGT